MKWNVRYCSSQKGYVTKFEIDDEYFMQFEVHTVGNHYHKRVMDIGGRIRNI